MNFSCITVQRIDIVGNKVESYFRIKITYNLSDVQILSKSQTLKNSNNLCMSIIQIGETADETHNPRAISIPKDTTEFIFTRIREEAPINIDHNKIQ